MAGKPSDFEPWETEILRDVARRTRVNEKLTGTALGAILGIAQQNASRFVGSSPIGGIARKHANRLAAHLGFRDAEELLQEEAVMREGVGGGGNVWHARDSAARIARTLGYPEDAIVAIIKRWTTKEHAGRPVKWWIAEIVLEEMKQAADRPLSPRLRIVP